jgi:hypothetical protein
MARYGFACSRLAFSSRISFCARAIPRPQGEASPRAGVRRRRRDLLHRAALVKPGERVLVVGAAGAVGQALLSLGRLAGLEMWGTARAAHFDLVRSLGATPVNLDVNDGPGLDPAGFDAVFDGIAGGTPIGIEPTCRSSSSSSRRGRSVRASPRGSGSRAWPTPTAASRRVDWTARSSSARDARCPQRQHPHC